MSEPVKCPKCKSEQVSAQKKGFSVSKAAAGVIVTGGVGALAGMHGSGDIEVHCLACGHKWDPAKLAKKKREIEQAASIRRGQARNEKISKFLHLYESGRKSEAEAVLRDVMPASLFTKNVDQIYQEQKKEKDVLNKAFAIIVGVVLAIVFGVAACLS